MNFTYTVNNLKKKKKKKEIFENAVLATLFQERLKNMKIIRRSLPSESSQGAVSVLPLVFFQVGHCERDYQ